MNGDLQNRIKPHSSKTTVDFNDLKVKDLNPKAEDANVSGKTSFKDLIMNSNDEAARQRAAQKNGDGLRAAKTDQEFAQAMSDKLNKENLRKPQNQMDKDSFLKLFITQMQNQDPLNPDDSAEMAAQLAQFNGLEQMMNVNKNLEKMQTDQAVSRAVNLVDFVGKEIKLDNGKLRLEGGKVSNGIMSLESEAPHASLEVRDASGALVATRDLGSLKKGDHQIEWNGLNNTGEKAPNGVYTFAVLGKDLNDQDVPVKVTSLVKVTGVDLKDLAGAFYTDLGKVRIDEVASVGTNGVFAKAAKASQDAVAAVEGDKQSDDKDAAAAGAAQSPKAAGPAGPKPEENGGEKPGTAAPAAPLEMANAVTAPAAVKQAAPEKPAPAPVQAQAVEPTADRRLSQPPTPLSSAMEIPFTGS